MRSSSLMCCPQPIALLQVRQWPGCFWVSEVLPPACNPINWRDIPAGRVTWADAISHGQELCLKFFKGIHVDAIHFCRPRLKARLCSLRVVQTFKSQMRVMTSGHDGASVSGRASEKSFHLSLFCKNLLCCASQHTEVVQTPRPCKRVPPWTT